MKRLYKKLHSQEGASILLALLLFLLCAMVAASILAAAVSNAGKNRSNRIEQQKYLTLTSALQLICDKLEQLEYTGVYTVTEWEVTTEEKIIDLNDPSKPVTATTETIESFFFCIQETGDYGSKGTDGSEGFNKLISFINALDKVFGEKFPMDPAGGDNGYNRLFSPEVEPPREFSLTVELPEYDSTGNNIKGYPYKEIAGPAAYKVDSVVTVTVKLESTNHITLTAWLGVSDTASDKTKVIAELVADRPMPDLGYTPGGKTGKTRQTVPDGAVIPAGTTLPTGTMIPAGTTLPPDGLSKLYYGMLTDEYVLSYDLKLTGEMTLPIGKFIPKYLQKEKDPATNTETEKTVTITFKTEHKTTDSINWKLNWIKKGGN